MITKRKLMNENAKDAAELGSKSTHTIKSYDKHSRNAPLQTKTKYWDSVGKMKNRMLQRFEKVQLGDVAI